MKPLRLVLVTRQFWPLVGGAQVVMGNLAAALTARGAEVTILTARWEATWPEELSRSGVRVVRLPQPAVRFWGTWRYMQSLRRWLRAHRQSYDLVYVSMLKHDAYAALAGAGSAPVVLRPEAVGESGDIFWQRQAHFGARIARRCRAATAVVAIAEAVRRELLAAGYPSERIVMIPNGVALPPTRDRAAQQIAREELAQADSRLAMPAGAPLAVYTGRLAARKGLATLIDAWALVTRKNPAARLWLVGDGPERGALATQIRHLGLGERVILAGRFDAVDDFLTAADVFVLPSHEELMSMAVLEAMAAGLPIAASDIPANRLLLSPATTPPTPACGRLTPPGERDSLAAALLELLSDPENASALGAMARERVQQHYSLDRLADAHWQLFENLLRSPRPAA